MANKGTWKLTLAGASFADYTDVLEPDGEAAVQKMFQTVNGYGAATPVFLDLGNAAFSQAFLLTRQHGSDTDAENFRQSAPAQSGVANVILTHVDYEGSESNWNITGAKVEIAVVGRVGLTTTTKIKITGLPVLAA